MALQNKHLLRQKAQVVWLWRSALACALLSACTCAAHISTAAAPDHAAKTGNEDKAEHVAKAVKRATWQLNPTDSGAHLDLPIVNPQPKTAVTLIIKLDALKVHTSEPKPVPEHYVRVDVACAGKAIKTSTFTTYPLGSAGEFRLQVLNVPSCFKPGLTTAVLKIKLQLQLVKPATPITLRGEVFIGQD